MTTADVAAAPLSDLDHRAQLRKAVIAATVGTTIEWYDFFIYGTAAGLVFGKLYFPNEAPLAATLAAFGTYFIGFVGRPITEPGWTRESATNPRIRLDVCGRWRQISWYRYRLRCAALQLRVKSPTSRFCVGERRR